LYTLLELLSIPILYLRKLWSGQLSSALISHPFTAAIRLLFVIVKFMLLDHLLLWKVNLSLPVFIICSCLLARYSSSFCLVSFLECHANSLTVNCYQSLLKDSHLWRTVIVHLFLKSCFLFGLQYQSIILAAKNFKFSCIVSKNAVSSFDICVISMASILLFGIMMAALCFPFQQ
jgi:hypothetical protein